MATVVHAVEKPNVLIVGDSISMNYTPLVQNLLLDVANVKRVPGNCQDSRYGLEHVGKWVSGEQWDVIHFNFGLWDWYGWHQDSNATPASYGKNLEQIVKHLKASCGEVIFATSTPPSPEAEHSSGVLVTPARAKEFRDVALNVMKANGIVVNDLYGVMLPELESHQIAANDVHFKPSGNAMLAREVATAIQEALVRSETHGEEVMAEYKREFEPLLQKHCLHCHGGDKQEANVRLDNLKLDFALERELWDRIEEQIGNNSMPPEEPLLDGEQRLKINDWIQIQKGKVDWSAYRQAGHVTLPLLNRNEYENTVRALFNEIQLQDDMTRFEFATSLSDDGVGDTGFSSDRDSPSLAMTSARMEKYLRITENVLDYYLYTDEEVVFEAEAKKMKATTAVLTPTENGIMIKANRDSLYITREFPRDGWYIVTAKAWGERVDNRACAEMLMYLDREEIGVVRLLSTRAQPGDYRCLVWIKKGNHTLRLSPQRAGMTAEEALLPVPPPFPDKPVVADFNDLGLGTGVYMCLSKVEVRGPVTELPDDFNRNENYDEGLIAPPGRSIITQQNTPSAERGYDQAWELKNGLVINREVSAEEIPARFTDVWVKPLVQTDFSSPPPVARLIEADGEGSKAVRDIIERFGSRAFRRPISEQDIDFFQGLYEAEVAAGGDHRDGLKVAFLAVMLSPDFFYRIPERGPPGQDRPLDSYEMASRLSYFLWNSMPDEELFKLAEAGKLTDPEVIDRQVVRMLKSPQGQRMVGVFAREWLGYRELGVTIKPDETLYGAAYYAGGFGNLFKRETERFVNHVFSKNRPLEELITADYAFWNRDLARYYGEASSASELLAASIHGSPHVGIAMPNGTYTLQLLFYEGYLNRLADIVVEGETIWEKYDMLAEQGEDFDNGNVLSYTFMLSDENIDIDVKGPVHLAGLILSQGKGDPGVSTTIVKSESDFDLNNVLKAINFGNTSNVKIRGVEFSAARANFEVDGVINKSKGHIYAGEFSQNLPWIDRASAEKRLGNDIVKIQLSEDSRRGGLLGMGSILTTTSHPTRTSAVDRGLWVYEKLFGKHLPDPPIVPALEVGTGEAGATETFRKVLEKHRASKHCASCHSKIDPIGFGLENFDPVGRWRELDGGKPIDAAGVLPDGGAFSGPRELKQRLVQNKADFYRNMARTVLTYALGRKLEFYDRPEVDKIVEQLLATNGRSHEVFKMVVKSYPFTHSSHRKNSGESK